MSVSKAHAPLATHVKRHNKHSGVAPAEAVQDARLDLAAEKLAEHIRKTVETAPPLSVTQKQRLAALLWSDR